MNRRSFLFALVSAPALAALVAACGDDRLRPGDTSPGSVPGSDGSPTSTIPATTVPAGIPHPNGAGEVVLRIGYEGGLVGPGFDFARTPALLISGAGLALVPGAVPAVYPGPLLMPIYERTIDEAGIQAVLVAAQAAGLLAPPPDYTLPDGLGVADAADTVVTIAAGGTTYVHRAYALDIDMAVSTPARDRLRRFVSLVGDLPTAVGAAHLGPEAPLVAASYRLQARAVDPAQFTDPKPTVVPWPSGTGVVLADAGTCAQVDATKVGTLFTDANQLTFFQDGAVVYQLALAAMLPGDSPC